MATCETCDGTGFRLSRSEDGIIRSERCDCVQTAGADRRLARTRIPKRYEHCSFAGDDAGDSSPYNAHVDSQRDALTIVRDWVEVWPADDSGNGLILLGDPGVGKTHLVAAAARALVLEKGADVLFYEQRELLKALQQTFEQATTIAESDVFRPVLACEVLVLDDLGAGRITPWAKDVLHDVISQRYNEARPMLITSNLPMGDEPGLPTGADAPMTLRDRLGDALLSRLHEMCQIVRLTGCPDYRRDIRRQSARY